MHAGGLRRDEQLDRDLPGCSDRRQAAAAPRSPVPSRRTHAGARDQTCPRRRGPSGRGERRRLPLRAAVAHPAESRPPRPAPPRRLRRAAARWRAGTRRLAGAPSPGRAAGSAPPTGRPPRSIPPNPPHRRRGRTRPPAAHGRRCRGRHRCAAGPPHLTKPVDLLLAPGGAGCAVRRSPPRLPNVWLARSASTRRHQQRAPGDGGGDLEARQLRQDQPAASPYLVDVVPSRRNLHVEPAEPGADGRPDPVPIVGQLRAGRLGRLDGGREVAAVAGQHARHDVDHQAPGPAAPTWPRNRQPGCGLVPTPGRDEGHGQMGGGHRPGPFGTLGSPDYLKRMQTERDRLSIAPQAAQPPRALGFEGSGPAGKSPATAGRTSRASAASASSGRPVHARCIASDDCAHSSLCGSARA